MNGEEIAEHLASLDPVSASLEAVRLRTTRETRPLLPSERRFQAGLTEQFGIAFDDTPVGGLSRPKGSPTVSRTTGSCEGWGL